MHVLVKMVGLVRMTMLTEAINVDAEQVIAALTVTTVGSR